jgi:hypothetical protein
MPSTYRGPAGTLRFETARVDVTSSSPRPDQNWRYTDHQRHEHYWQDGYPTLVEVVDRTYWCPDCADEHTDTHLECPLCHEVIVPGLLPPPMWREFAPGRTSYYLDDVEITEAEAKAFMEARRSSDS